MTERRARILVVDDDPLFRRSVVRQLGRRYDVVTCGCVADVLSVALHDHDAFDLVLLDVHLGDESGFDVHALLTCHAPDLAAVTVYATGDDAEELHGRPVLAKPFSIADVAAAIDRMTRRTPTVAA